ncbi:MAG: hypothetical protein WCK88_04305 [bacterium]
MIHEVGEVLILMHKNNEERKSNKKGRVFCDPRTSGLFDSNQFEIVENREEWENILRKHETLTTDPDFLTQTLREQLEQYGV